MITHKMQATGQVDFKGVSLDPGTLFELNAYGVDNKMRALWMISTNGVRVKITPNEARRLLLCKVAVRYRKPESQEALAPHHENEGVPRRFVVWG